MAKLIVDGVLHNGLEPIESICPACSCARNQFVCPTRPRVLVSTLVAYQRHLIAREQSRPFEIARQDRSAEDKFVEPNVVILLHGFARDPCSKAVSSQTGALIVTAQVYLGARSDRSE